MAAPGSPTRERRTGSAAPQCGETSRPAVASRVADRLRRTGSAAPQCGDASRPSAAPRVADLGCAAPGAPHPSAARPRARPQRRALRIGCAALGCGAPNSGAELSGYASLTRPTPTTLQRPRPWRPPRPAGPSRLRAERSDGQSAAMPIRVPRRRMMGIAALCPSYGSRARERIDRLIKQSNNKPSWAATGREGNKTRDPGVKGSAGGWNHAHTAAR